MKPINREAYRIFVSLAIDSKETCTTYLLNVLRITIASYTKATQRSYSKIFDIY